MRSRCIVPLAVLMALLTGCAGTTTTPREIQDDYFARQLPGLMSSEHLLMSPVDNPVVGLNSLSHSPPRKIREALLAQHERWAGTPYRLGGTGFGGVDCSALVQNIFSETFHLQLPRSTGELVQQGTQVARDALQIGDLVFFRPSGRYHHVGIYIGDGYFLHASTSKGVILSKLNNSYWKRHYWQARRTLEPTLLAQRVSERYEG